MRIPKLAAECGLTEQYEDVKITPVDGYVDGEWYAHQGVQVIEWPALENCVTIDAEACNELRAVFHMLGEQVGGLRPHVAEFAATSQRAFNAIAGDFASVTRMDEPKPWPFPTGRAPEKQPGPPPPLVLRDFCFGGYIFDQMQKPTIFDKLRQAKAASVTQPSEPQVRSRSAAAKSPLNGLLTEQSGRYCGLGFNGED
jgi:hypothetical protein